MTNFKITKNLFFKIYKLLPILFIPLLLNACGGGGGGAGGAASYTVTNCTDGGAASHKDTEYYYNGSVYHSLKPYAAICASSAYARGATGDGIQVAVIDTGVDHDGTDIDANMIAFTTGSDVVNSDNDASDDNGHGTNVAGIIAAEHNSSGMHGVAYNAEIYGFKAFNAAGAAPSGATGAAYALVEAIGAIDIINNSWTSEGTCTSASDCRSKIGTTLYDNWEDVSQLSTPKISVFAAGNSGESEPDLQCQTMKYNSDINAVTCLFFSFWFV